VARRVDPEPITIFMAIVATYTASVSTANFVKTHYKALPTRVRSKLLASLTELDDQAERLRADVKIIADIFDKARFPAGSSIRLGNGAHLSPSEFSRYQKTSDNVIRTLRAVHKLCLNMERQALKLEALEMHSATNVLGEAYTKLDALLESRNLTSKKAWAELDSIAEALERAIKDLRGQLGSP
jgi:hypothetical protein